MAEDIYAQMRQTPKQKKVELAQVKSARKLAKYRSKNPKPSKQEKAKTAYEQLQAHAQDTWEKLKLQREITHHLRNEIEHLKKLLKEAKAVDTTC